MDIIAENKNAVYLLAYKYSKYVKGNQFEDLLQEGYTALLESKEKFDEHKGVKFLTFAFWNVRKRMQEFVRQNSSTVKSPKFNKVFVIEELFDINEEATQENLEIRKQVFSLFSDKVFHILRFYFMGYTLTEIGEKLEISCERVRQLISEDVEKIKRRIK